MSPQAVERVERTVAVENAAYRWSHQVLSVGVLALAAYRSFVLHEDTWDLIMLVVVSGAVSTLYQAWRRTLHRRWVVMSVVTFAIACVLAAAVAIARKP